MDLDTDELAQKLYDRSLVAEEVPVAALQDILNRAHPGHETIDEPEQYRWFLIEGVPTKDLEVTLSGLMEDSGDYASQQKWQHDLIVNLLKRGEPAWPALVTAWGVIVDGYHRIAAHRTLKDKTMSVVVAVRRESDELWDELWNEAVREQMS